MKKYVVVVDGKRHEAQSVDIVEGQHGFKFTTVDGREYKGFADECTVYEYEGVYVITGAVFSNR